MSDGVYEDPAVVELVNATRGLLDALPALMVYCGEPEERLERAVRAIPIPEDER